MEFFFLEHPPRCLTLNENWPRKSLISLFHDNKKLIIGNSWTVFLCENNNVRVQLLQTVCMRDLSLGINFSEFMKFERFVGNERIWLTVLKFRKTINKDLIHEQLTKIRPKFTATFIEKILATTTRTSKFFARWN